MTGTVAVEHDAPSSTSSSGSSASSERTVKNVDGGSCIRSPTTTSWCARCIAGTASSIGIWLASS